MIYVLYALNLVYINLFPQSDSRQQKMSYRIIDTKKNIWTNIFYLQVQPLGSVEYLSWKNLPHEDRENMLTSLDATKFNLLDTEKAWL